MQCLEIIYFKAMQCMKQSTMAASFSDIDETPLTWLDILFPLTVVRIFLPVVDTAEAHQTKELSIYEDKSKGALSNTMC